MKTRLGRTVILVEDYDKAYEFYSLNFSCRKIHDSNVPGGRRYLHIAFSGDDNTGIWLLKAEGESKAGQQTGKQPTLVIYTDDIESLYSQVQNNGVRITESLASTSESRFFHCQDLYGNRLTVVELF